MKILSGLTLSAVYILLSACGGTVEPQANSAYSNSSSSSSREVVENVLVKDIDFPDPILARCVASTGVEAIADFKELNCPGNDDEKIASSAGVDYLIALTTLDLSQNSLKSIDVSENVALTSLIVGKNQLTEIDLSNNVLLTNLDISDNPLLTIDLSKNSALKRLTLFGARITTVDISQNLSLEFLDFMNSGVEQLDLSANAALKYLNLGYTPLKSLDLSKNTSLQKLYLSGSRRFTSLDLSNNIELIDLSLYDNFLTELDLSNNVKLKSLTLYANPIASLDLSFNQQLNNILIANSQLTCAAADEMKKKYAGIDFYFDGDCVALDGSGGYFPNFGGVDPGAVVSDPLIEDLKFPDPILADCVRSTGKKVVSELTELTCLGPLSDDGFSYKGGVKSVAGLESLVGLKYLNLSYSQFANLDLSSNSQLQTLLVSNSALTTINLTKNNLLSNLNLVNNHLIHLDLSENTELRDLFISERGLLELNLNRNTALKNFLFAENQLIPSIDLSRNQSLYWLYVTHTSIANLDLSFNRELTQLTLIGNSSMATPIIANDAPLMEVHVSGNAFSCSEAGDCLKH